ncbi:MAG: hypothetical protein MJZ32_09840 [Bacteroidaceae bacterium]|nr:hypothetical protein [Bacteroidaceae bacterium]
MMNGMTTTEDKYEYELVEMLFEYSYIQNEEEYEWLVCEDDPTNEVKEEPSIVLDAEGIPMGETQEEKILRREIIHQYVQQWRADHEMNPRVYNEDIKEYIKVNQVFLLESVTHSAHRYQSTKAVLHMEEVMAKATKVCVVKVKENSNQKPFKEMLMMRYSSEDLGKVKMLVGVRKRTQEKVEYSITVPSEDVPFIDKSQVRKRKKRPK